MTEVLQNVQHVYEKWEKSGPYKVSSPYQEAPKHSKSPSSFKRVVSSGQQAWRDKFGNLKPPQYKRSRSKNNTADTSKVIYNILHFYRLMNLFICKTGIFMCNKYLKFPLSFKVHKI